MPVTTYISTPPEDPKHDTELTELLREFRTLTGKPWYVEESVTIEPRLLRKPKTTIRYELLLRVSEPDGFHQKILGVHEYQTFACATTAREIKAFLFGGLNR